MSEIGVGDRFHVFHGHDSVDKCKVTSGAENHQNRYHHGDEDDLKWCVEVFFCGCKVIAKIKSGVVWTSDIVKTIVDRHGSTTYSYGDLNLTRL